MATFNNGGPLVLFPGFQSVDVIAPVLQAAVVQFQSEFLDALSLAPEEYLAAADIGTNVVQGVFEGRIPMRLPGSLAFTENPGGDGSRTYQQQYIAAPIVKTTPFQLNFEWPWILGGGGEKVIADLYGFAGLAAQYLTAGRTHKVTMLGTLRNKAYGTGALALTIPQPGYPNGLPLYTDGSVTASHFSHPFKADSVRFNNLYLTAGKYDSDALLTTQTNMMKIPHPTLPNMPAGYRVKHIKGPTWMQSVFYKVALANLQLQITGGVGAATTNIASMAKLKELGESAYIGATGIGPVTYHIDPTMDNHPLVAGTTKHFWEAIDGSPQRAPYVNFMVPNTTFMPLIRLLGDGSEEAIKTGMIRMFGDLHAGVAAGWPGGVALYYEG